MKTLTIAIAATALISACGGGGSDPASAPVTSTQSFPLRSAYKALIASGMSKSFTISGTCAGTGSRASSAAATPATFEGVQGLSATTTIAFNFSNCMPATFETSVTAYFGPSYDPLGISGIGTDTKYGVYLTPLTIPETTTVSGATGTGMLGTQTLYTNSSKSLSAGVVQQSYIMEADTADTAIVNLIFRSYDASSVLTSTEQTRYRITTSGTLTPVSTDIQYSNGNTTHLVLTY